MYPCVCYTLRVFFFFFFFFFLLLFFFLFYCGASAGPLFCGRRLVYTVLVSPRPPNKSRPICWRTGTAWRFVFRLKNRKGEPSNAVLITFEGCTLPTDVWIACTPHRVSAFAGSVRRCTKCQVIGRTKSQCRSRVTRCSRCGAGGHAVEGCSNTLKPVLNWANVSSRT